MSCDWKVHILGIGSFKALRLNYFLPPKVSLNLIIFMGKHGNSKMWKFKKKKWKKQP